jgi:hypothetical protein
MTSYPVHENVASSDILLLLLPHRREMHKSEAGLTYSMYEGYCRNTRGKILYREDPGDDVP